MVTEIHGVANRPVNDNVDSAATLGSAAVRAAARNGAGPRSDQVSLTTSAALLQELEKAIAQLPIVDTGRVESVQLALATGTFQFDPPHIADKLLQLELVLNGAD